MYDNETIPVLRYENIKSMLNYDENGKILLVILHFIMDKFPKILNTLQHEWSMTYIHVKNKTTNLKCVFAIYIFCIGLFLVPTYFVCFDSFRFVPLFLVLVCLLGSFLVFLFVSQPLVHV